MEKVKKTNESGIGNNTRFDEKMSIGVRQQMPRSLRAKTIHVGKVLRSTEISENPLPINKLQ